MPHRSDNQDEHHRFLLGVVNGVCASWRRLQGMTTKTEDLERLASLLSREQVDVVSQFILTA